MSSNCPKCGAGQNLDPIDGNGSTWFICGTVYRENGSMSRRGVCCRIAELKSENSELQRLLRKYIRHVQYCQGTSFLDSTHNDNNSAGITAEEWGQLSEIADSE